MSMQDTRLPRSAKQAPVTRPTYPVPTIVIVATLPPTLRGTVAAHSVGLYLVFVQVFSPPAVQRGAMAVRISGALPGPRPPGTPTAAGPAGGTTLPPSAAALQTDSPSHCPSRNCPYATALPAVAPAPPRCWSARRLLPAQRSTGPATTCSARGTAPPLC